MAGRRLRVVKTHRVTLSDALRAIVDDDRVIIYDRARGSFFATRREAEVLATALATVDEDSQSAAAVEFDTVEVELSPSLRALIGGGQVVLWDRGRSGTVLTIREAKILAGAVGTTDKVDLSKKGSN